MKTFKKIGAGLCLLLAMFLLLLAGKKVLALQSSDFKSPPATYTRSITTAITAVLGDGSLVTFNTSDITASPVIFTPANNQFNGGVFCSGTQISMPNSSSTSGTITARWINTTTGQTCGPPLVISTYQGSISAPLPSGGGSNPNNSNTCEQSSAFGFEWLLCGVLRGLGDFIDKVNGFIEQQLNFDVSSNLNANVHQAWNVFRIISSALLVIIMLVMVFSQAISAGPFDAYTVRKLLPRLVAAVILIQISWFLSIYIINIANDLGKGIADLLAAPFGGTSKLNIADLIGNLGGVATGTTVIGGFLATIVAVAINPFGAVMLAFFVFIGVIIATAVLLVRVALIIGCVIFMPVALVAWILPGTEKYWKLLWDNFIKALLLFPLIIATIYVGRIFAWIFGTSGNSPILGIFAVMIGFFGPYFLFPRMFKWGGNIMSAATNGIETGVNKLGGEQGKKFIQSRQEELKAERTRRSAERVATREGFNAARPWRFPIDKFKSGDWDPTRGVIPKGALGGRLNKEGSRRRQVAHDRYVQAGEESYQKDLESARARILRQGQAVRAQGGNWDRFFQQIADGGGKFEDDHLDAPIDLGETTELERMAARKQLATLGAQTNWRYLESYYEKMRDEGSGMSQADRVEARKFFDDNVQTIQPKLPHLYAGIGAAADSKASAIGQMHGVEVESILGNLSKTINDTTKTAAQRSSAQGSLLTFLRNFQEAAANPNIGVDNGALRAVKAFLDPTGGSEFRNDINLSPDAKGNPTIDGRSSRSLPILQSSGSVSLSPDVKTEMDKLKTTLADRIDPVTGTYSVSPAPGSVIAAPPSTAVPAANLDSPDSSGWTPRQQAFAENATRNEYNAYRARIDRSATDPVGYPPLSPEEHQRYEQIRSSHPEW